MTEFLSVLPAEITIAMVAFLALVTALRALVVLLQKLAAKTETTEDDKALAGLAALLDRVERGLDWVSVGPTARKR